MQIFLILGLYNMTQAMSCVAILRQNVSAFRVQCVFGVKNIQFEDK